ncbi:retron St85 family effector protein [Pinirhizobacter soli]|uniref:retron St85 family effector protein n=1 Tax=Pinirhizobacter soli TaxID=2786953 RepID=UPI00202A9D4A|nr:retron St85 family effector protein [Pinirhizobacter soli]
MQGDPRSTLVRNISLERSKVRPFEGYVFLCGGTINIRSAQPTSLRDAIYRGLAENQEIEKRIRLAEHYKDWSNDGVYTDLVEFEKHLAELSSLIVLVLESAGSIAELGLFSAIEQYSDKLLLYVASNYYEETSFIRLGPIKYLEEAKGNFAHYYPWLKEVANELIFDAEYATSLAEEFRQTVSDRLDRPTQERTFDKNNWLHRSLLICELVSLMSALTIGEVRTFLNNLDIDTNLTSLRQQLFLLAKVGLLKIEPSGDQRFYVINDAREFLVIYAEGRDFFDKSRFRSDVILHYSRTDKKRFRALQRAREAAL